ncbi:MAG: hypothetical protein ACIAS6_08705 [Phycisphaerales bacterium JB060]
MPWRTIRRCLLCAILGLVTSVLVAWGAVVHVKLRPQGMSHMQTGVAVVDGVIQRVQRHRRFGLAAERWQLVDTANLTFGADIWPEAAREIEAIGGAAYDAQVWASAAANTPPTPMPTITGRLDDLAASGPPEPVPDIADVRTSLTFNDFGWPLPALRSVTRYDSFASQAGSPGMPPGMGNRYEVRHAIAIPWHRKGNAAINTTPDPLNLPLKPLPGLAINTIAFAVLWGMILYAPGATRRASRRALNRCTACGYALKGQPGPGCPECGQGR